MFLKLENGATLLVQHWTTCAQEASQLEDQAGAKLCPPWERPSRYVIVYSYTYMSVWTCKLNPHWHRKGCYWENCAKEQLFFKTRYTWSWYSLKEGKKGIADRHQKAPIVSTLRWRGQSVKCHLKVQNRLLSQPSNIRHFLREAPKG